MLEEYETPPLGPETENAKIQLLNLRQKWDLQVKAIPSNGSVWQVIPRLFWEQMCLTEAESAEDLAQKVGKIDCSLLVDETGAMYPEDQSPPCMAISPELFHSLALAFGVKGSPVARTIFVDETGNVSLERTPPLFVLHVLTKDSNSPARNRYSLLHSRMAFSLSLLSTFQQLVEAAQSHVYKNPRTSNPIRLWIVEAETARDMLSLVSVSAFIDAPGVKSLVTPNLYGSTLRSQGIQNARIDLVVEPSDRKTFFIDAYLASHMGVLDYGSITSSGGRSGLSNLGNTCYMNSALQCLTHIPELNYYFFFDLYRKELNTDNPLGYKGEVAAAFSSLLHKLYGSGSQTVVTPREFKYTVGRHSSIFHGFQQQDSQEFVSWLLDALHEDLNRIHQKPYCEKPELKDEDVNNPEAIRQMALTCWDQYKKRNDSVIVDLFTGMYQSTLVCPTCSKESMTFDPFNDLTLPLPVNKKWYHELIIVDLSADHAASGRQPISKLEVELDKSSNFDDLINYISGFLRVPAEYIFLYELYTNYFYRDFQENTAASKYYPINELISDNDVIAAYIIPHDFSKEFVVPVIHTVREEDPSYDMTYIFGFPLFMTLDKEADVFSLETIEDKVKNSAKVLSRADIESFESTEEIADGSLKEQKDKLDDDTEMEDPSDLTSLSNDDAEVDVPKANTKVPGVVIKYYEQSGHRYAPVHGYGKGSHMRSRYQQRVQEPNDANKRSPNVPLGKPSFLKLPLLTDKLPKSKLELHNTECISKKNGPPSSSIIARNLGGLLKIPTDESAEDSDGPIKSPLNDDDDSDTNFDDLKPLAGSESPKPSAPPPIPSNDSDEETRSELDKMSEADYVGTENPRRALVDDKMSLICEWSSELFNKFFKDRELQAWENLENIPNPTLEANKRKLAQQQKSTVSLYDCLKNFSTPEVLGEQDLWYCPRCKDHKRATKTIRIWSTGDILTIHLKRFSSARAFSDKINMVVDFPIEGLQLNDYVQESHEEPLIYDLVAVDNHYGGLGGGHYTAYAKNFRDQKWYYFNDSGVNVVNDPTESIKGAAYLLFYKKRKLTAVAGGDSVEQLLNKGRQAFELKLQHLREQLESLTKQIDLFEEAQNEILRQEEESRLANSHAPTIEIGQELNLELVTSPDSEDDLYEDSTTDVGKARPSLIEQPMNMELLRKQRLLSKGTDLPRSVKIEHEYSSSVSNLASPVNSSNEVESPTKDSSTSQ